MKDVVPGTGKRKERGVSNEIRGIKMKVIHQSFLFRQPALPSIGAIATRASFLVTCCSGAAMLTHLHQKSLPPLFLYLLVLRHFRILIFAVSAQGH